MSKEILEVRKTPVRRKAQTAKDVTKEYLESATPGKGSITYDDGYKLKGRQAEISAAAWVYCTFGGDIRLLAESPKRDVKTPDFLRNGKKWELKGARSVNGADKSLQHAIKQIQDNPAGALSLFVPSPRTAKFFSKPLDIS